MKVYVLLDCSVSPDEPVGVPVGVFQSLTDVIHEARLRSQDYGYDVGQDHYVGIMVLGNSYPADSVNWALINDVKGMIEL